MLIIIARALYELKSSGASWRAKLAETLMSLGYKSYESDADIWMKRDFNPNEDLYYEYIMCYVDDFLHISFNPKEDMDDLNIIYQLKEDFGPPDQYIGANF